MIHVRVRLFASLRERLGQSMLILELNEGATVADALAQLAPTVGQTAGLAVAVNQRYATEATPLAAGDEVALLPPVSGGSAAPRFEITAAPISLDEVAQRVTVPTHGAVILFAGIVRGDSESGQTEYLEYEAYADMAVACFAQIADEVVARWPSVTGVVIVHRCGRLEVGETSVAIAIAAAHRQGTFEACSYAIERLKAIAPIWKKEVGPDGSYWVEGPRAG